MHSSLIRMVHKAQNYAREPERVSVSQLGAFFEGKHDCYTINYDEGNWKCSCDHFRAQLFCSHIMAVERMLKGMIR